MSLFKKLKTLFSKPAVSENQHNIQVEDQDRTISKNRTVNKDSIKISIKQEIVKNDLPSNHSPYVPLEEKYSDLIQQYVMPKWESSSAGLMHNIESYKRNSCPYCGFQFEKQITRKQKCTNCAETVYVRTDPVSKSKMIIEADSIEKTDQFIQDFYKLKTELEFIHKIGVDGQDIETFIMHYPSSRSYDVAWKTLNQKADNYAADWKLGLFCSTRFNMAKLSYQEGRKESALVFALGVFYLDINGVTNFAQELLTHGSPFRKDLSFAPPGIVQFIKELIEELEIDDQTLYDLFTTNYEIGFDPLTPFSIDESFQKLIDELNKKVEIPTNQYDKANLAFEKHKNNELNEEIVKMLIEALDEGLSKHYQALSYRTLGEFYQDKDTEKAIDYFNKALAIDEKIGVKRALNNLLKLKN